MKIIEIIEKGIKYFPYLNVSGGKIGKTIRRDLPIYRGYVDELPDDLDALIVTSDLQGNIRSNDEILLLGEVLPEFLKNLLETELKDIRPEATGVLLCGDMYATLLKRGGLGDVRSVWYAFREHFRWVAGVAGNHDDFGTFHEKLEFKLKEQDIYFLEKENVEVDQLKVGGVSGIIGTKKRTNRVPESDFLDYILDSLMKKPDILLLHHGPSYEEKDLWGSPEVREVLEMSKRPVLVCSGHCHWSKHLVELKNKTQVLNADGKVFILTKK